MGEWLVGRTETFSYPWVNLEYSGKTWAATPFYDGGDMGVSKLVDTTISISH